MQYEAEDIAALLREHPQFYRPSRVRGPRLTFRDSTRGDAEFILSLRLNPLKNAYLSVVSPDVQKQQAWLEAYANDRSQIYFVIEHEGEAVGTVRLYDQRGTSFAWGSWILSDQAPSGSAVESTLMVYRVGLELGFKQAHFDVRKKNKKVWQYHERLGAERVGQTDLDYLYKIQMPAILALMERYQDRGLILVDW